MDDNSLRQNSSPLWPNAAPRSPIRFIRRDHPVRSHEGLNVYHVDGANHVIHVIHVIDGEPLESILNRVYALGMLDAQKGIEDLAVGLAADALKELAGNTNKSEVSA